MPSEFNPTSSSSLIDKIYQAFNEHCEIIHQEAVKKLEALPEEDVEGRKAVLTEQKAQLDKTLAELKAVLNNIVRRERDRIEEEEKNQFESNFNIDSALT